MTDLLMPKATAMWLIRNTGLTFKQISDFCHLHVLEVQRLADEEHINLRPFDPIASGQITISEIRRCEANPQEKLQLCIPEIITKKKKSGKSYVPLAKRGLRPSAIAWIVENYPDVPDRYIVKLLNTTTKMVQSIRDPEYRRKKNIVAQDPVKSEMVTQEVFDQILGPHISS